MADIGSLYWAEEKVDELFHIYEQFLCKASTLQVPVREIAGKENLKFLSQELEEALAVIRSHQGPFEKTRIHEHAEILKDDLDRELSGLS